MFYAKHYKKAIVGCLRKFYLIFIVLMPLPVLAAAITNLDSKPHEIIAEGKQVTIQPNETWRHTGKVDVLYKDIKQHLEEREEFAIWNDKDFGPQFLNSPGSAHLR